MISDFFFFILKSRLVTGIDCCPLPIADIGNGYARYQSELLITGKMPVTDDGLFVTLDR
jgi:hypothetical protein